MSRINDKIDEIESFLQELSEIIPSHFEQYQSEFQTRAACERYFEKIIEAVVDLAFFVIKERKFKIPEEDKQAFDILAQEKTISNNLAERLSDAKGMRNILAHEYGKVNDEIVFEAIKNELIDDAQEFIKQIKKSLKKEK